MPAGKFTQSIHFTIEVPRSPFNVQRMSAKSALVPSLSSAFMRNSRMSVDAARRGSMKMEDDACSAQDGSGGDCRPGSLCNTAIPGRESRRHCDPVIPGREAAASKAGKFSDGVSGHIIQWVGFCETSSHVSRFSLLVSRCSFLVARVVEKAYRLRRLTYAVSLCRVAVVESRIQP